MEVYEVYLETTQKRSIRRRSHCDPSGFLRGAANTLSISSIFIPVPSRCSKLLHVTFA